MVADIDEGEKHAEVVFSLEAFDAVVDVFGVEAVVFEGEEECAGCGAEDVVGGDVGVFPCEGAEVREDWIAFLARGDED